MLSPKVLISSLLAYALLPCVTSKWHRPYGKCSYYGAEAHGALTANGERFNMMAMTAAHRNLPFGTWVRVTNLQNGKKVDVRINDRGSYIYGRPLDLSQGAFQRVEDTDKGLFDCNYAILK